MQIPDSPDPVVVATPAPEKATPAGTTNLSLPLDRQQATALIGAAILFIGVFLPIVHVPVMGSLNYFQNGKGDGVVVLVLAGLSAFLAVMQNYRWLWATGLGSIGMIAFTFVNFLLRMSDAKAGLTRDLADNPFAGLAHMAVDAVQLQWGWAILVVGAVTVILAATVETTGAARGDERARADAGDGDAG